MGATERSYRMSLERVDSRIEGMQVAGGWWPLEYYKGRAEGLGIGNLESAECLE